MQTRTALNTTQTSALSSSKVVELNGYVIILVQGKDGKIKLYGSPAEKDNLEVADEILDINEKTLEDLPRAEVIRHIHECIQSCMIKLRVKRRSDSKLAGELGSVVQDAFVIAVEQQARERLQRLSALKRVTPVDMTLLSMKLNQQNSGEAGTKATNDYSFLKDVSPIYVASFEARSNANATNSTVAIAPAVSLASATLPAMKLSIEDTKNNDKIKAPTLETNQQDLQNQQLQQTQLQQLNTEKTSIPAAVAQNDHNDNNNQTTNRNSKIDLPESVKSTQNSVIPQTQQNNIQSTSITTLSRKNSTNFSQQTVNVQRPQIQTQTNSLQRSNSRPQQQEIRSQITSTAPTNYENDLTLRTLNSTQQRSFKRSSSTEPNGIQKKSLQYNSSQPLQQPQPIIVNSSIQQQQQQSTKPAISNKDYSTLVYNSTSILHNLNNIRLTNGSSNGKIEKCYNCMQNNIYSTINQTTEFQNDKTSDCSCDLSVNNRQQTTNLNDKTIDEQNNTIKYHAYNNRINIGAESNLNICPDDITYANENGLTKLSAASELLKSHLNKRRLTVLSDRIFSAMSLISDSQISEAFHIQKIVSEILSKQIYGPPIINKSQHLSKDVTEELSQCNSMHAIELANLLTSHEMEGLFLAHDKIAETAYIVICQIDLEKQQQHQQQQHQQQQLLVQHQQHQLQQQQKQKQQQHQQQLILNKKLKDVLNKQQNQNYPTVHSVTKPCMLTNNSQITLPQPLQQAEAEQAVYQTGLHDINKQIETESKGLIKLIHIEKSSEPLGATVRNEGDAVVIARIVRGGVAEKSGLLHEGDEILEVNNIKMRRKTVNEVCNLLGAMTGTLTFLIIPASATIKVGGRESTILHVRAHFDYDPADDLYIPCRELGLSFQKGDVLHVISRDDPNWWQAYREGEEDQNLAGLIPSQSFQHQRETMKLAIAEEAALLRSKAKDNNKGSGMLCARKGKKRRRKANESGHSLRSVALSDESDEEEILTYEEVALYYPNSSHKRPIVLIGPPNIGRHELRQRLMSDSERFAAAIPHTSRTRRDGEIPGQDYHFITKEQFEADILARRFVEHGEYEKAYYGTSLEAIRKVITDSKICVLNLHPQSLKLLRASDIKPYVVFVAPPSLEKLRQRTLGMGDSGKEENLKDIIATARDMEARWGHLFDMIIINNDTEKAYHQLLAEINSLEREPQWVPAIWLVNERADL